MGSPGLAFATLVSPSETASYRITQVSYADLDHATQSRMTHYTRRSKATFHAFPRCLDFFTPKAAATYKISLVAVFASALLAAPAHAQKTTIQPPDIVNLKRSLTRSISPDGKLVAYTVETPVPAGKHRDAHILLAPAGDTDARHPFAYSGAAEDCPPGRRRHAPRLPLQPRQPSRQRRALALSFLPGPRHRHAKTSPAKP